MASRPPIRLPDRYTLRGHIASGGMASVWEAEDGLLGRTVAVKVLAPHFAEDPDARDRFAREARMAASVSSHAHVVTVYDVGEHEGAVFLVMEHFAGGTVAQRIRRFRDDGGRPDRDVALRWLRDAAAGLQVAHAAGIVHRDVKPANLLIDGSGRVAVGDFGIARVLDAAAFTATGEILGTAAYLSPEQAAGRPATAASDGYALAVVAFELLTGRRPFPEGPFAAQALAHAQTEPPRASSIDPALPPGVDAALSRGLAKDPADRPPSATALVEELAAACAGRVPAHPEGPPTRRIAEPPTREIASEPAPRRIEPAPPRRPAPAPRAAPPPVPARAAPSRTRRGAVLALLALLSIAAGGAAAAVLLAGDDDDGGRTRAGTTPRTSTGERTQPPRTTSTPPATATAATPPPEPEPEPEPAPAPEPATGDPAGLNDAGFALIRQERYGEAVAPLKQAVDALRTGGRTNELTYAYALYNLGLALNRSGDPASAIPYLEERLGFPNQRGVVKQELDDARGSAGRGATDEGGPGDEGGDRSDR